MSLAKARKAAEKARDALGDGINPKGIRQAAEGSTFGECADRLIEAMRPSWRNSKHAKQWEMTLRDYAAPLRRLPVDAISTEDVLGVLKPLWSDRRETGLRVRSRIERVLDAAKAEGKRSGDNPARWRGHLDRLLPRRKQIDRGHHAAMPYADVPAFMERLRSREGLAARALDFTILTAARTNEILGARWREFDIDKAVWTVPASRMKLERAHRVPLSKPALKLLQAMRGDDGFVFPGEKAGSSMGHTALSDVLEAMEVENATVHGFRSSFRDWAAEETAFPNHVVEQALAHAIGDKVEAAYRRGDLFDKRRKLMDAWSQYCSSSAANVVPLRRTQ